MKNYPSDIYERSKKYAIDCHAKRNLLYDGEPYSYHLYMAEEEAMEFKYLIPPDEFAIVLGGVWTHDVIEDTGETFNDVSKATCPEVAELSYAVSNEKGKTREERANPKYYKGIREMRRAKFVKLTDRLANVKHSYKKSLSGNRSMFRKYKNENDKFIYELVRPDNFLLKIKGFFYILFSSKEAYIDYLKRKSRYAPMINKLENYFW